MKPGEKNFKSLLSEVMNQGNSKEKNQGIQLDDLLIDLKITEEIFANFVGELLKKLSILVPSIQTSVLNYEKKELYEQIYTKLNFLVLNVNKPKKINPEIQNLKKLFLANNIDFTQTDEIEKLFIQCLKAHYSEYWNSNTETYWRSSLRKILSKVSKQKKANPIYSKHQKSEKKMNTNESNSKELQAIIEAIHKVQAIIEFNMDGTIITANNNFLNLVGYTLDEIKGRHHQIFVDKKFASSPEYSQFWERLNNGQHQAAEYKRIGKGGKEVWIQASYNPILDENKKPYKVVKFATDVTDSKLQSADAQGQINAISSSQAVIEFDLNGNVLNANDNFLNVMDYSLKEIVGKHHRMFVETKFANSSEYSQFWTKLNNGEYQAGEFKRLGKSGKEVWIQASYNPILNLNGEPFKVVKYATDVTDSKLKNADFEGQLNAVSKAQAVIEFNMDGTIITANDNFLHTVGYTLPEIQGKHHRIFVEESFSKSEEYRQFWEKLNRGEFEAAEYKRIGKGGKSVWIQASYNPIFDLNGKPFKVVKYATDVTETTLQKEAYRIEVEKLTKAANNGDLSVRGDLSLMGGIYKPMLEGLNNVMDAIIAPIAELKNQLAMVAKGDLTAYVTGNYTGDHADLKNALNETLDSLNEVLNQVKSGSNQIAQGSNEVASNAQSLSQGATEQASSLEEITASMTELSGQTKQNAENAQMANQLATQARSNAEGGNQQMQNMVNAMSDISESSKNISKIIKVIDEIAFQTNLLALNAAVEAARAGVHGKGFAVVAEEVRNLAARSAKAAKETTDLIENSKDKVNSGTEIANQTSTALQEIVGSIGKVSDLVGEIAAASNEQSQGINQVNQGLSQLDSVTQQNTASAEESAAAAEELNAQTLKLQEMLKKFTLKEIEAAASMSNLSPEMLQAFQEFMKHHNGGSALAAPQQNAYSGVSNGKSSGQKINPNEIINLDDSDFGKY